MTRCVLLVMLLMACVSSLKLGYGPASVEVEFVTPIEKCALYTEAPECRPMTE